MKRVLILFVSLSSFCSFYSAPAQAGMQQRPQIHVSDLIRQGQLDRAIAVLETEVNATNRTAEQRGRAYALLGYAYKEVGKFESAQRSFDRALRLMDAGGDRSRDYATTLDVYAELLMNTGDLESAAKALHEAAGVESRLENHADLARTYSHTAEIEIERKKYKKAREALAFARAQAEAAHVEGNAILPVIAATSGWLAISMGKIDEGVAAYSIALAECKQQYGEKNPTTGWSYLLLGKAEELDNDLTRAVQNMNAGLEILRQTVGTGNIRYVAGELAYSDLLDHTGSHVEALRVSSAAHQLLKSLGLQRCAGCTVSVWSLRHEGQ
jgi:lipopolysaccharide biosynthesis regulator YciM